MSDFDAYYEWLGIPSSDRPISKYRLLGLAKYEENPRVINAAAERQTVYLRTMQAGENANLVAKLLNEVSEARVTLLNPERKLAYDRQLRNELAPAHENFPLASSSESPAQVTSPLLPTPPQSLRISSRSPNSKTRNASRPTWKRPTLIGVTVGCVIMIIALLIMRRGSVSNSTVSSTPPHRVATLKNSNQPDLVTSQTVDSPSPESSSETKQSIENEDSAQVEVERMSQVPLTLKVATHFTKKKSVDDNLLPDYLKGSSTWVFTKQPSTSEPNGILRFKVELKGRVYLLAHWQYQGNKSGPWFSERLTKPQLIEQGWALVEPAPWDKEVFIFTKTVEAGESYSIRTNKYWPPYLVTSQTVDLKPPLSITNSISMEFTKILPGKFMMGSPQTETGRGTDEHQREETITKAFYLQTTEVTQGQWKAVMDTEPWKEQPNTKEGSAYAATFVNWDDALAYCRALSEREDKKYRLPTEAEWEFACRAGGNTGWSYGNDETVLGEYAWYNKNANDLGNKYAHQVRLKKANAFGLYDMHGNVMEWCMDYYRKGIREQSSANDPVETITEDSRVLRGGTWFNSANDIRAARRHQLRREERNHYSGFRLVRQLD